MCPLMSVPASGQQAFEHRPGGFLVVAVLGRGGRGAEGLFQERGADAPGRPTPRSEAGVHGRSFIIWAKRASRTQMTLPSWARPATACSRKACVPGPASRALSGRTPKARPNAASTFSCVAGREEVHGGGVVPLDQRDLQLPHEPGRRHPEIVADHDDGLDAPAVALPQRLHQLGVGVLAPGVQPLLELVEHDQDLLPAGRTRPRRRAASASARPSPGRSGQRLRSAASSRASVRSAVAST